MASKRSCQNALLMVKTNHKGAKTVEKIGDALGGVIITIKSPFISSKIGMGFGSKLIAV